MLSIHEAFTQIEQTVRPQPAETIALQAAHRRVLAEPIASDRNSPPFDKALMDGFACRSTDIAAGHAELTVLETVVAGRTPTAAVTPGTAVQIMTGAPLPDGADVVVRVEDTEICAGERGGRTVHITNTQDVRPETNILRCGSSMRVGDALIPADRVLRPQEIALLAELGRHEVAVRRQPRVAILATGDELTPVGDPLGPGQIHNTNEPMLCALLEKAGAMPHPLGIARDNRSDLAAKIAEGLACDFLILSGGVSAGTRDLVPSELQNAGVEQIFHKVHLKPGKPLWFGVRRKPQPTHAETQDASGGPTNTEHLTYVFGLPGNPVSSMVCCELFVQTALLRWQSCETTRPRRFRAKLGIAYQHRGDRPTFFPGWYRGTRPLPDENSAMPAPGTDNSGEFEVGVVHPTGWIGSADLRATIEANCLIEFPDQAIDYDRGAEVPVILW